MSSVISRLSVKRTLITLAAGMLVIGVVLLLHRPNTTSSAPGSSGRASLPNLAFPDLNGSEQNLSDYRGRPLFVNMWATWCPPCRAEIPDLQRLFTSEKQSGFTVLGVDQGQDAEPVSMFVSDYKLTYPILVDKSEQLSSSLGSSGLPTTLVYDRAGKLVDVVIGMMTPGVMQAELEKATTE